MAHWCPACDEVCYCSGDVRDAVIGTLECCEHPDCTEYEEEIDIHPLHFTEKF